MNTRTTTILALAALFALDLHYHPIDFKQLYEKTQIASTSGDDRDATAARDSLDALTDDSEVA